MVPKVSSPNKYEEYPYRTIQIRGTINIESVLQWRIDDNCMIIKINIKFALTAII